MFEKIKNVTEANFNLQFDTVMVQNSFRCHMEAKFGLFVDEDHCKLPTLYGYLNFINGSSCCRFVFVLL